MRECPHFQQWIEYPNKKINKQKVDLNNTVDNMDFQGIHKHFIQHQQNQHYYQAHLEYPQGWVMLGQKKTLNKFKKLVSFQVACIQ
jgi:hypothetical protein